MNFFEQQDKARRQSRILVGLFLLAVLAIASAIGSVAYLIGGWPLVPWASGSVLVIMLGASLVKTLTLRQGGGYVARSLNGTLVDPNTTDPLRQRLHNVVEEMAIAAGVSVPEVYVLEHESAINAFAAGYSPSDAAIAVTRGLLEQLDREELQGVIAHEFSHILNGDMRMNIRLMGVVFGILVIALMGQHLMHSARFSRNSKDSAPLVIIALFVVLIGYIGLFFARLIKAGVSRQREYLADAAAVQFTRNPQGISGALKKIGLLSEGAHLKVESEEVGHMLFGQGGPGRLFATHPPLMKRIQAIEPGFSEQDLEAFEHHLKTGEAVRAASSSGSTVQSPSSTPLNALEIVAAASLLQEMPDDLKQAAHSDQHVEALLGYLMVCEHQGSPQVMWDPMAEFLSPESISDIRRWWSEQGRLHKAWCLPLLEMALPSLRRRTENDLIRLQTMLDQLMRLDGHLTPFEYALDRLLRDQLQGLQDPASVSVSGHRSLAQCQAAVASLLAWVAKVGAPHSPEEARARWGEAMGALFATVPNGPVDEDHMATLDAALPKLRQLRAQDKLALGQGLVALVQSDGRITDDEYALVRVLAALMGLPLPLHATH